MQYPHQSRGRDYQVFCRGKFRQLLPPFRSSLLFLASPLCCNHIHHHYRNLHIEAQQKKNIAKKGRGLHGYTTCLPVFLLQIRASFISLHITLARLFPSSQSRVLSPDSRFRDPLSLGLWVKMQFDLRIHKDGVYSSSSLLLLMYVFSLSSAFAKTRMEDLIQRGIWVGELQLCCLHLSWHSYLSWSFFSLSFSMFLAKRATISTNVSFFAANSLSLSHLLRVRE